MFNEAAARGDDPLAVKVREQTGIMRDQVARHLERARIAARLTIIGTVTEVAPVIEALRRTMEKIHRDRDISIDVEADASAKFRGERQDLEEMAGNLVDNACKWAESRVFIEVLAERAGAGPMLRIIVDDDGRGLSADERAKVSRRGQRLDESKPGSGLGLSIVRTVAEAHGGTATVIAPPAGGLEVVVSLPGLVAEPAKAMFSTSTLCLAKKPFSMPMSSGTKENTCATALPTRILSAAPAGVATASAAMRASTRTRMRIGLLPDSFSYY